MTFEGGVQFAIRLVVKPQFAAAGINRFQMFPKFTKEINQRTTGIFFSRKSKKRNSFQKSHKPKSLFAVLLERKNLLTVKIAFVYG